MCQKQKHQKLITTNALRAGSRVSLSEWESTMAETIKLDQFLKLAQVVATGGQAKQLIQDGQVRVNGEVELRRGRKLVAGDVVLVDGEELVVAEEGE
jgi:ribosome-associated protein